MSHCPSLSISGNDVIRGDQSSGKINFKTSAAVGGRWQERGTFRVVSWLYEVHLCY